MSAKMGDKLLSITYFDNFDFQSTLFSKNVPKFRHSIPNQAKSLEHFYGRFHAMLSCSSEVTVKHQSIKIPCRFTMTVFV